MTVIVNLQFSANKGKINDCIAFMKSGEGIELTRKQKGLQKMEVAIDETNNKFAYWEHWDSVEDFNTYLAWRQDKYGNQMQELFDMETFKFEIIPFADI